MPVSMTNWGNTKLMPGVGPNYFGNNGADSTPQPTTPAGALQGLSQVLPGQLNAGGGSMLSPSIVLIGMALLLLGLKFIGEHDRAEGISPAHFHVGAYNILTVTVAAVLGIVTLKIIFNSYHVPGVTDVINAA